jgi:hypothetical protein
VFCWHKQRKDSGLADGIDLKRYERLARRQGLKHDWTPSNVEEFGQDAKRIHGLRQPPKRVRQKPD